MTDGATNFASQKKPQLLVVTEGIAGTENQCLSIGERLGLDTTIKRISLNQPWAMLSPYLGLECAKTFKGDPLSPPWPDILIAAGRKAIAACRYIKKQSGGKTITVFLQNPRINPKEFDLVIAPAHDQIKGETIFITNGTPTKYTPSLINQIKQNHPSPFSNTSSEKLNIAFIVGGGIAGRAMDENEQTKIINAVTNLSQQNDKTIFIIGSRRTPPHLIEQLKSFPVQSWFWGDDAPNPYQPAIAHADIVIVTADSPSMISDCASGGKPTYVLGTPQTKRHDLLIKHLSKQSMIRLYDAKENAAHHLTNFTPTPLKDAEDAANEIKRRFPHLFSNAL